MQISPKVQVHKWIPPFHIYRPHSEGMGKVLFWQVSVCSQEGAPSPSHNTSIHRSRVLSRGTPVPGLMSLPGGTCIQSRQGLPHPVLMRVPHLVPMGVPPLGLDESTPIGTDWGTPLLGRIGYPPIKTGWDTPVRKDEVFPILGRMGYPLSGKMGYPLSGRMGHPLSARWGYPPCQDWMWVPTPRPPTLPPPSVRRQSSRASTCYAGARYASCVHAGGLSCLKQFNGVYGKYWRSSKGIPNSALVHMFVCLFHPQVTQIVSSWVSINKTGNGVSLIQQLKTESTTSQIKTPRSPMSGNLHCLICHIYYV